MKIIFTVVLTIACACFSNAQAIQKTYCTHSPTCSLPNPVSSGNMIVAIGGLPDAFDSQDDTFFEIPAAGWYATPSPMWYATGVHGGLVTVQCCLVTLGGFPDIPYIYLAEYPPATLDQVAPEVFNCCNPSVSIGLTTTFPSELLIEWTSYTPSVSVQDAVVSPGAQSFTIPGAGAPTAYGVSLASFRLLGPEFSRYKAPYAPIQIKGCALSTSCQFDKPVSKNDLLIAAISNIRCLYVGSVQQPGCVTDSDANPWTMAVGVPYDGSIWYVLNAQPGVSTVSFLGYPFNANIIIAEYPPAVALDVASYGTYAGQNIDGSNGQSDDTGYTNPLQTTKACDLLVSMGIVNAPPDPTSNWLPTPVPYFTVRAGLAQRIGFEDSTSTIPGLYFASMNFGIYTHWTEGLAAFDLNGCK